MSDVYGAGSSANKRKSFRWDSRCPTRPVQIIAWLESRLWEMGAWTVVATRPGAVLSVATQRNTP